MVFGDVPSDHACRGRLNNREIAGSVGGGRGGGKRIKRKATRGRPQHCTYRETKQSPSTKTLPCWGQRSRHATASSSKEKNTNPNKHIRTAVCACVTDCCTQAKPAPMQQLTARQGERFTHQNRPPGAVQRPSQEKELPTEVRIRSGEKSIRPRTKHAPRVWC